MKKKELDKKKKRGQGFAEYALLAAGIMIVIALAVWNFRDVFQNANSYVRCVLRVATYHASTDQNRPSYGGCGQCLSDNGNYDVGGDNFCL